jgi:hypothetical protein
MLVASVGTGDRASPRWQKSSTRQTAQKLRFWIEASRARPWRRSASSISLGQPCLSPGLGRPQSRAGSPGLLSWNRLRESRFDTQNQNVLRSPADSSSPSQARTYITIARFSSSCCRTGNAQPAISTRLAASSAALGETPYPRPIRNTCNNSAAS